MDTDRATAGGPNGRVMALAHRATAKVRELGVLGTLQLVPKNLRHLAEVWVDERYDRLRGIRTAGYRELDELSIASPNKAYGIRYQPTTHRRLVAMFANLPPDLADFTFVDLGCGRGRVLLFAARFNFRRIVGVEFSEELHRSAVENLAVADPGRVCRDIRALHQDASAFALPEGPLVLYLFDPFRDRVMRQVLENIRSAYQAAPRKIIVLYLAPVHEDLVMATGIFRKRATPPLPHEYVLPHQYRLAMFETGPDPGA